MLLHLEDIPSEPDSDISTFLTFFYWFRGKNDPQICTMNSLVLKYREPNDYSDALLEVHSS